MLDVFTEAEILLSLGIVSPAQPVSLICRPEGRKDDISPLCKNPILTEPLVIPEVWRAKIQLREKGVSPANIRIFGVVSSNNVGPGATLTYTLVLINSDEFPVENIEVVSVISSGFRVVSLDPGEKFIAGSDLDDESVIFSGGMLDVGEFVSLKITGLAPEGGKGSIENVVTVEKSINSPITITTNIDPALGPDLRIFYVGGSEDVTPGDSLTFLFLVRNDGLTTATNISFRCIISSSDIYTVTRVAATGDFAARLEGYIVKCTGGTLAPSQVETLEIQGIVNEVTNQGEIALIAEIDPKNAITERDEFNNQVAISRIVVPVTEVLGTDVSEEIVGTPGPDRIIGGGGRDTIAGGAGGNIFVYNQLSEGGDRIIDFKPGDKIDITGVLRQLGYTGSDPIADGYISVRIRPDSPHLQLLMLDVDGPASRGRFRSLLVIEGEHQLTLEDLIF